MGFLETMRKTFRLPARAAKYDLDRFPELEGLAPTRKDHESYTEWITSAYAYEMRRRFEYYEVNQVVQDPAKLKGQKYIKPALWKEAHSGSGWDDIRAMLPDATENTIVKPMITNFTQVVVDNTGVVYSVPPTERQVLKGKDVQAEDTELLNDVYAAANHDIMADQLCKWTGLFSTAFQQISYDEANDRIQKTNLQPQDVYVIPDKSRPWDLQHPNCFVAIRQDLDWETKQRTAAKIIWQCWWGRYWWYETEECVPFQDLDLMTEGVNENPYWREDKTGASFPVKPILVTHSKITGRVHDSGSDALIQQNQVFDRGMTGITHTQEFQGFAIPVFSGTDVEEVEANPYSAAAPVILRDPQAKLQFAHPAAPIGEGQGAVIKGMRTIARLHQIDPELVDPETKVQSGVSRAQGRIALAEKRMVEYPKWIPFERESYWLTSIVWNYHNPEGRQFTVIARFDSPNVRVPEKFSVLVQFGELAPVTDPMADAATNKMNLELDLIDRADIVATQRAIPKVRAQAIVDENRKKNRVEAPLTVLKMADMRLGQSGNRPTNPDRPEDKTGGNITSTSGNQAIPKSGDK